MLTEEKEKGQAMKIIYTAGAFRAPTPWEVEQNVRVAEREALRVAQLGAMPVCPHSMLRHFDQARGVSDDHWLQGTLELMRRCDAVLVVGEYFRSEGTRAEIVEAERLGLPVFFWVSELADWLKARAA
jgi:nucleoside 2-deoxyribosyltransferase